MLALGFALGIYLLPTLIAPPAPSVETLEEIAEAAVYQAEFKRELAGSDFLHWGQGRVSLTAEAISLEGKLAPGPDYQLYLVPQFVESEAEFLAVKSAAHLVGPVKTFENFSVPVTAPVDFSRYNTVLVWCESFSEFITAGRYRD